VPDQISPGSPPPEVPEEFAAAYRAAYERALTAQSEGARHREHAAPDPGEELPRRRGAPRVGTHTTPPRSGGLHSRVWFVPLLLVLLGLLLVTGAYVVGRALADRLESGGSGAEPTVVMREDGASEPQPISRQRPAEGAWKGRVVPLGGVRARTGCTSPSGVDAAGREITYGAANLTDGAADTTWRCDGRAVGEKITLDLGGDRRVAEVGLIPGYAKTDDQSGADRYAENNRVTLARWTIGDEVVEQRIPDDVGDRSLRVIRVPLTTTDTVGLQILDVAKGPRGTTAISEVQVSRAR